MGGFASVGVSTRGCDTNRAVHVTLRGYTYIFNCTVSTSTVHLYTSSSAQLLHQVGTSCPGECTDGLIHMDEGKLNISRRPQECSCWRNIQVNEVHNLISICSDGGKEEFDSCGVLLGISDNHMDWSRNRYWGTTRRKTTGRQLARSGEVWEQWWWRQLDWTVAGRGGKWRSDLVQLPWEGAEQWEGTGYSV